MNFLVVDDSLFYRNRIVNVLKEVYPSALIHTAINGKEALEVLSKTQIDLVTLDIEMPIMGGIETLKNIREMKYKTDVIVFSSSSSEGAKMAFDALSVGARDFIVKPQTDSFDESLRYIKSEIIPRVNSIVEKIKFKSTPAPVKTTRQTLLSKPSLICIGSSTGGPEALKKLFAGIKIIPNCPILLVQHMPAFFTKQLAQTLSKISIIPIVHCDTLMTAEPGKCYIAPGDFHMKAKINNQSLTLFQDQSEKVCYVRPSFDVLLYSLENYSGEIWSFVLTGMGEDGAAGLEKTKNSKSKIYIQDKESSIVWGMPGAVAAKKLQNDILTLEEMAEVFNQA